MCPMTHRLHSRRPLKRFYLMPISLKPTGPANLYQGLDPIPAAAFEYKRLAAIGPLGLLCKTRRKLLKQKTRLLPGGSDLSIINRIIPDVSGGGRPWPKRALPRIRIPRFYIPWIRTRTIRNCSMGIIWTISTGIIIWTSISCRLKCTISSIATNFCFIHSVNSSVFSSCQRAPVNPYLPFHAPTFLLRPCLSLHGLPWRKIYAAETYCEMALNLTLAS